MIKKLKVILIVFCILSLIKTIYVLNKDIKQLNKKVITGIIVDKKVYPDKETIVVKDSYKYRITVYKSTNLKLGDKVKIEGSFEVAQNNTIPNLFNYRKYLLSKKIFYISNNPKITLIKENKNVLYDVKNSVTNHIQKYKSSMYLKTFILSDNSELEDDIKQSYRNVGISHLFSVSGMHVGLFMLVFSAFLKKYKYKDIIVLIFILFYLFLTGFPDSLVRCFLFMFLRYLNKTFMLKIKNEYLLILTFHFLLFINPYYIYSLGFWFSIIITFYLVISNNIIKGNYLKKSSLISFISFLASIPILSFSSFKFNLLTPLFNLIMVPLVSFIIFPLGLITFFIPFFDNFYLLILNIFEYITNLFDSINLFTFIIPKTNLVFISLYYISLYLSIKRSKKIIIIYFILLFINININSFSNNIKIVYLDVGQGDSNIIKISNKTIMIDTGGIYNSNYSVILNKTIPYLNSIGIKKINYFVLTHGDYDHMGEAINLVNNFKVKNVVFNSDSYNELEQELIKELEKKKIRYYKKLKKLNIGNNKLYFLNTKEYGNENDDSNVIYFKLNNYKFLFMGDAGIKREKEILNKYNLTDIDFIKIGHHGSNTSSSKNFIDTIKPRNCLISVGKNNRYGHPKDSVIDILDDYCDIYRTDSNGSIEIKINKNGYKVKTYSP